LEVKEKIKKLKIPSVFIMISIISLQALTIFLPLKDCCSYGGQMGVWATSLNLISFLDILKLFVNMYLGISFAGLKIS
jgi:hypothetical protein